MKNIVIKLLESEANREGNVNSLSEIIEWIEELNKMTKVKIEEASINCDSFWFYDDYNGEILNRRRSFFSIKGVQRFEKNELIIEQPMIFQPEIGYLGIIAKDIDGTINFLMQAKIEPGNVNCVQISPTIQATKSNFTRVHGGKMPNYFEYFEMSEKYLTITDQIQSEQTSRFYKKRNRNMIILVDEDIEVYSNYKWMTLGQIKELLKIDNLINMDTRTVISNIPFSDICFEDKDKKRISELFQNKYIYNSVFSTSIHKNLINLFGYINNYKMYEEIRHVIVPLNQLQFWKIDENGIKCKKPFPFYVQYYDIEIQGREVNEWMQPLFKAIEQAVFGLLLCKSEGKYEFLVRATADMGNFDYLELGPTVQMDSRNCDKNFIDYLFISMLEENRNIKANVILSEEGGRFYHEQNRNAIIEINKEELEPLPKGYFWVDYATLNYLIQINNCINIQLRNLMSLLEI